MIYPIQKLSLLFLFLLFLNGDISYSQQVTTFDSIYTPAGGEPGKAKFEYYEDREGRKIKHGDFTFIRENRPESSGTTAVYEFWKGRYNENVKVGEWVYETRKHLVDIRNISDVNLDYSILTEEEVLNITYNNGFPEGEILMESTLYANKEPVKKLKNFRTNLQNGRIHGEFEFLAANETEDSLSVYGRVENGLMVEEWGFNYFYDDRRETRNYERGVLLELTKAGGDQEPKILDFPISDGLRAALNNEETTVELANKPLSLHFSDGYPRTSVYIQEQQKGEDALLAILKDVFRYDPGIDLSRQLPLGTNRGFYPLSSEERDYLAEWPEVEALYRNTLQELNSMRIENLNVVQDDDIQLILNWAERQQDLREYIKPWNNILSKEQIEYYNREGLLVDYAQNLLARDTITYGDEQEIFQYAPREERENFLLYIVDNFKDRNKVGDSLMQVFANKMETLEINREIAGLDETIRKKKEEVDSIFSIPVNYPGLDNLLSRTYNNFDENIYEKNLDRFLYHDELSEKIEVGQNLVVNLEILKEIHSAAVDISTRHEQIDELYTELTFDPFTFSDQVPVRKKKRLYNLVAGDIMGGLINRAGENVSEPTEVLKDLQLALQMQERLVFLEDKNTRRLERRLRRSNSLNDRIELLNSL